MQFPPDRLLAMQFIPGAGAAEYAVDSPGLLAQPPAPRLLPVVEDLAHTDPSPAPEK